MYVWWILPSTVDGTTMTEVGILFSTKYSDKYTASVRVVVEPTKMSPVNLSF